MTAALRRAIIRCGGASNRMSDQFPRSLSNRRNRIYFFVLNGAAPDIWVCRGWVVRKDKRFMIKVKSRGTESAEQMLRRFKKLCEKEGLTKDIKRVAYYEKPSEKRRRRQRKGGPRVGTGMGGGGGGSRR
jgi:small subunit ribosomal protein S21